MVATDTGPGWRDYGAYAGASPRRSEYRAEDDLAWDAPPAELHSTHVPPFSPAHWNSLRPATAPGRYTPRGASGAAASSPRSSIPATRSSVIRSSSGVLNSPRKSDPVSMHARREQQWKTDSFLMNSPRRSMSVPSPAPARTAVSCKRSSRAQNTYVVPTTKRRDQLIWDTRMRLREGASSSTPRRKEMVPNKYVPPTEKRRNELRWQVRSDMAWRG